MKLALLWVAAWAASPHGPYPTGNAVAQPDLQNVLPANQAEDQTFRMIVKPDIWGTEARIRLSNVFGDRAITFDGAYVGVHNSAGSVVRGSNRAVKFQGMPAATVKAGETVWSDPISLAKAGVGAKLAVSFHVAGSSGGMTWHAKAMTTSYLTASRGGSHGAEESSDAFPFTTTSWFFLDAIEMRALAGTSVIAAFGDSITDGTNSTINGDDRWPDFLSQRLHAAYGDRYVVVNEGIGGNRILTSSGGGPAALERLQRDVVDLAGLKTVIWLEGINDLGSSGASAESVIEGFRKGVAAMHAKGIRVVGATITSSLGSTPTHGTPEVDAKRKVINEFIRHGGVFDAVADFDAATIDPATGGLQARFQPSSSTGGPGDKLHPNRAGYQAMARSVRLQDATDGH